MIAIAVSLCIEQIPARDGRKISPEISPRGYAIPWDIARSGGTYGRDYFRPNQEFRTQWHRLKSAFTPSRPHHSQGAALRGGPSRFRSTSGPACVAATCRAEGPARQWPSPPANSYESENGDGTALGRMGIGPLAPPPPAHRAGAVGCPRHSPRFARRPGRTVNDSSRMQAGRRDCSAALRPRCEKTRRCPGSNTSRAEVPAVRPAAPTFRDMRKTLRPTEASAVSAAAIVRGRTERLRGSEGTDRAEGQAPRKLEMRGGRKAPESPCRSNYLPLIFDVVAPCLEPRSRHPRRPMLRSGFLRRPRAPVRPALCDPAHSGQGKAITAPVRQNAGTGDEMRPLEAHRSAVVTGCTATGCTGRPEGQRGRSTGAKPCSAMQTSTVRSRRPSVGSRR